MGVQFARTSRQGSGPGLLMETVSDRQIYKYGHLLMRQIAILAVRGELHAKIQQQQEDHEAPAKLTARARRTARPGGAGVAG